MSTFSIKAFNYMNQNDLTSNEAATLKAAEACVLDGKTQKLSMGMIARAAGLSRRTIYRTFASKNELLAALFESHLLNSVAVPVTKKIAKLGFDDALLEGNLLTIKLIKGDAFLFEAIQKSGAAWFHEQIMDSSSAVYSTILAGSVIMWEEKFKEFREQGELNTELTDLEIMEWLSQVNYSLIMRTDATRAKQAAIYKKFVIPSLRATT